MKKIEIIIISLLAINTGNFIKNNTLNVYASKSHYYKSNNKYVLKSKLAQISSAQSSLAQISSAQSSSAQSSSAQSSLTQSSLAQISSAQNSSAQSSSAQSSLTQNSSTQSSSIQNSSAQSSSTQSSSTQSSSVQSSSTQNSSAQFFNNNASWETNLNGQPLIQQLNNNNEITYCNQAKGKFYNIIENAIQNWNNLGVIKFVPVNINQNPEIKIDTSNEQFLGSKENKEAVGSTKITNINNIINSAWISLNDSNDMQILFSNKDYINVAEHELGHALGFDHDGSKYVINNKYYVHIMNPDSGDDRLIPLGETEANALRRHYVIK